jgi:hypothetical protein
VNTATHHRDSLKVREVNGEFLLLDGQVNQIHQLNATASFIWRICGTGAEVHEIASDLATEYGLQMQAALKDVSETVAKLRSLNLLAND